MRAILIVGSRVLLRDEAGDGASARLPRVDELEAVFGSERLERVVIPAGAPGPGGTRVSIFGFDDDGQPGTDTAPDDDSLPSGFRLDGLRAAYHRLTREEFRAAGTARQKVEWARTHRFCSRCGERTERHPEHEAMHCTSCGQMHFPRVAPAVIVLVERPGAALLGRSARFPAGVYSTLAGFVESGESLEECVHREIGEEVGVRVGNLRYFGSQPHPFPHSLMVGFVADWLEGEIRIDPREIEDARWFTPDELPELPHPMSIARALIEDFVARQE